MKMVHFVGLVGGCLVVYTAGQQLKTGAHRRAGEKAAARELADAPRGGGGPAYLTQQDVARLRSAAAPPSRLLNTNAFSVDALDVSGGAARKHCR